MLCHEVFVYSWFASFLLGSTKLISAARYNISPKISPISLNLYPYAYPVVGVSHVASWSSGRHLASGLGGLTFKSWLCKVDTESLGKVLYMHFVTPLMCKTSTQLQAV